MDKLLLLITFFLSFLGFSQEDKTTDSLIRITTIEYHKQEKSTLFTPITPSLEQIAGAPKAFYSHYWEFGDGKYSMQKTPNHTYKNNREYTVRLWATNNYDTGNPPTSRPKKIVISNADPEFKDEAVMTSDFSLKRNREPMPEEELVSIISYKNELDYTTNGKLYLFYNEQKYKADNFEITDIRTHNGEQKIQETSFVYTNTVNNSDSYIASATNEIFQFNTKIQDSTKKTNLPLTLAEAKTIYKHWSLLEFNDLQPNEERNVFYSLKTTPEMLKDTSAIISVRGVFVPDSNYDNHTVKDMEMEIVTSHDPNKMSSNGTFMNYRLVRFKEMKFKIKFQNNGEGPARTIRLETDIPKMFDKQSIEIESMYPECKICPKKKEVRYSCLDTTFTKTKAIFTFKNIYLPGSEQNNVKEYDSTKGYVKYSIKFNKNFHKKKTKSRTAIIFDKNEAIITNYSTTRFLPGISIGVKAGYNYYTNLNDSKSYFVGATISPYKSYRWYWQVELLNNFHKFNSAKTTTETNTQTVVQGNTLNHIIRTTNHSSYSNIDWEIPLLLRYNINNYIGLGAGMHATISLQEKQNNFTFTEDIEDTFIPANSSVLTTTTTSNSSSKEKTEFTNFRSGLLVEATGGFARIGPSIGVRYIFNFKENYNYLQLYALWKF